jgi:arginine/lysine/ornithine decarboxylase
MLYEALDYYAKKGVAPFHMPGHKRNTRLLGKDLPYGIDITEIDGFDNLQDPRGILKAISSRAASLYGGGKAYLLVNGGTGGILAAVKSAAKAGDTIVMARGCHKSVYDAVGLFGLRPVYLMPETDACGVSGSIRPEQVRSALDAHPDASLVVVTSPTYEGVVSDIAGIADIAHRRNIPVLVDAAHGAHLGFSDVFPPSAVQGGADLVVTSLHKTLPALTQCALALSSGKRVEPGRLRAAVSIFQTSSPSYVLLSSIDRCVELLETGGTCLFERYEKNLRAFDEQIKGLKKLRVLCHGADHASRHGRFFSFDPGKLVILTRGAGLTGVELAALLRAEHRVELEMAGPDYAVAMTSICDEDGQYKRLADALHAVDAAPKTKIVKRLPVFPVLPSMRLTPSEAAGYKGVFTELRRSAGRISLEYVWAYPPGIPFLVPGELVTDELVEYIDALVFDGVALKSTRRRLPALYTTGLHA